MCQVTVVIAAYNASQFISRSLQSVLTQGDVSIEVIVIDDCSTDDTRAVVEEFARHDTRLKVISLSRNGGPSVARNAGLEQARGDWVAILDADDVFMPGRLHRLLAATERDQVDIIADNFCTYNLRTGRRSAPALTLRRTDEIIDAHSFVARARPFMPEADYGLLKPMFRRRFLEMHGLNYAPSVRHGEDFLLIFSALMCGAKYLLTRRPGYLYTTRSSGWSRTTIDYEAQIAKSLELSMAPDIAGDPRLSGLLTRRAEALRTLSDQRRKRLLAAEKVDTAWRDRQFLTLAWLATTDLPAATEILRKAKRSILR